MPKQKRFRNLRKLISGSTSHQHPSLDTFEQPNSNPNNPVVTPPHPPQLSPVVNNVASQSPPGASSQAAQPDTQSSGHKVGRHSSHYWFVDAIDEEHDITQKLKLNVKDVHDLADGWRVVVEFDDCFSPIGEAAGLLAGVCGQVATNTTLFPISFDKWSDLPEAFFNKQWNILFVVKHEDIAKRFVEQSVGKKWKEYRLKLWDEFYDPTMSKDDIIKNVPEGVSLEQWATFVKYRFKPETMELCKRNREIRKKQIIPHTCGAKTLARRRHELKIETGKTLGRGPMWNITHKRKDGSYVNDVAMEIGETIEHHISCSSEASSEISPNDAVGVVFGKEHPGRVRALGMGAVPTLVFKETTMRLSGMEFGSSSSGPSYGDLEKKVESMESELQEVAIVKTQMQTQMQALFAYISAKEGGKIPDELAGLFTSSTQQAPDARSGASPTKKSSNGSNANIADLPPPPPPNGI